MAVIAGYAADKAGPITWPHASESLHPGRDAAGFLCRLRYRGNGAMPVVPGVAGFATGPFARCSTRPQGSVAAAAGAGGVVRPVLRSGTGRAAPPEVRGRAAALCSAGGGDGRPMAGGRSGRGAACPRSGAPRSSAPSRLRSGRSAGPRRVAAAGDALAGRAGAVPQHGAAIRPGTNRALGQRSRGIRPAGANRCRGRSGQMDRPGGRCLDDWLDVGGLCRGAVRGRGRGGFGSDRGPRALIYVNPWKPQVAAGSYTCRMAAANREKCVAVPVSPAVHA